MAEWAKSAAIANMLGRSKSESGARLCYTWIENLFKFEARTQVKRNISIRAEYKFPSHLIG